MALPKQNRLRSRRDFKQVYQQGRRYTSQRLTLRGLPPQSQSDCDLATRIGVSISRKVDKRATVRNRCKRQIWAACRQLLPNLATGWKIVIVVRPGTQACEYDDFLRELKQLLVQAEVLHGHSREQLL